MIDTNPFLKVTFWDVGQGDCSTIEIPDGSVIIIDTGPRGSPIVDWLNRGSSPKKIHSIITTHNHEDHVGALPSILLSGKKIDAIWMLEDRANPLDRKPTKDLFRLAIEGERRKCWCFERLEKGKTIWEDSTMRAKLQVVFPSFAHSLVAASANRPNDASGILQLVINDQVQVIWPGDSSLETIVTVCPKAHPEIIVGPHHGGPEDYKSPESKTHVMMMSPKQTYISVGTKNHYSHPRPKYLRLLAKNGTYIACSQITRECDKHLVNEKKRPVMETHMLLGLPPPRNDGYACRGPMQLYFDKTGYVKDDGYTQMHKSRIKILERPMCQLCSKGTKK